MLSVDCNFDDLQNSIVKSCGIDNSAYCRVFFKGYDKLIVRVDLNVFNKVEFKETLYYKEHCFKVIIEINSENNEFVFDGTIKKVLDEVVSFVEEHKVDSGC